MSHVKYRKTSIYIRSDNINNKQCTVPSHFAKHVVIEFNKGKVYNMVSYASPGYNTIRIYCTTPWKKKKVNKYTSTCIVCDSTCSTFWYLGNVYYSLKSNFIERLENVFLRIWLAEHTLAFILDFLLWDWYYWFKY